MVRAMAEYQRWKLRRQGEKRDGAAPGDPAAGAAGGDGTVRARPGVVAVYMEATDAGDGTRTVEAACAVHVPPARNPRDAWAQATHAYFWREGREGGRDDIGRMRQRIAGANAVVTYDAGALRMATEAAGEEDAVGIVDMGAAVARQAGRKQRLRTVATANGAKAGARWQQRQAPGAMWRG